MLLVKRYISKILQLLRAKGYITPYKTSDKIRYILHHIDMLDIYGNMDNTTTFKVLEKDIVTYINMLENIVRQDMNTNRVIVKDIIPDYLKEIDIYSWYSNSGRYITGYDTIITFLKHSVIISQWYENNNTSNDKLFIYNTRRLGPYYNNISIIVDYIYNNYYNKL